MSIRNNIKSVGILGFGAFGQLIAQHLSGHLPVCVYDPVLRKPSELNVGVGNLAQIAQCDLIVLAVPVSKMRSATQDIAPLLGPGSIVVDVGSVKLVPANIMVEELPPYVDIVGTHPLFGPQSAGNSIVGHKIAVCPVRGRSHLAVAAFLKKILGLKAYIVTPEEHDREASVVQGITHLIAKVLVKMEPLPDRLTTRSFDLLRQAVEMVRHDSPAVYTAIENENPFSAGVRDEFFQLAEQARLNLSASHKQE